MIGRRRRRRFWAQHESGSGFGEVQAMLGALIVAHSQPSAGARHQKVPMLLMGEFLWGLVCQGATDRKTAILRRPMFRWLGWHLLMLGPEQSWLLVIRGALGTSQAWVHDSRRFP